MDFVWPHEGLSVLLVGRARWQDCVPRYITYFNFNTMVLPRPTLYFFRAVGRSGHVTPMPLVSGTLL
jgi:hypothetical protein